MGIVLFVNMRAVIPVETLLTAPIGSTSRIACPCLYQVGFLYQVATFSIKRPNRLRP